MRARCECARLSAVIGADGGITFGGGQISLNKLRFCLTQTVGLEWIWPITFR